MFKMIVLAMCILIASATIIQAPAGSSIGDLTFGGTGCLPGTVQAIYSGNTITVLFDNYIATTSPGQKVARATCNYAIPVTVPNGFSVSLVKIDYRGFAQIPTQAVGTFEAEYFFAGSTGPKKTQIFPAGFNDDFTITDSIVGTAVVFSPCGQQVIVRGNTDARVDKNTPFTPDGSIEIDTADATHRVVYHLSWAKC